MTNPRHKRDLRRDKLSRDALRSLFGIVALLLVAVTGGLVLGSRTKKPDLFDLIPKQPSVDGRTLLAWYDLERGYRAIRAGGISSGIPVRVLGYMVISRERARDGQAVNRFVLVPDPINATHPAHRFGDQMIAVRLPENETVVFLDGQLLWVWGTLRALPGNPNGEVPLYELVDARCEVARDSEIPKYFR